MYFPHQPKMDVQQVLHMNGGEGETSYLKNSLYQQGVMLKVRPILEQSITDLYCTKLPEFLNIADLGCSSGPNTLLPLWEIVETLDTTCRRLNRKPPVLQVFLNDLPGNDFNAIFRTLPSFYDELKKEKGDSFGPCFVAGMPGSFLGRLFPDRSIHFFHSSYSIHFLSQPPEALTSKAGALVNKGNICTAKTSPPGVREAYWDQFEKDFTTFLRSRSKEMVPGGRMVHTVMGRTEQMDDPSCENSWEIWSLIGTTLDDMVAEGLIGESVLDAFNVPLYVPSAEELRLLIEKEGSFDIVRFETFEEKWDASIEGCDKDSPLDVHERGKHVAARMRAVTEPLLVSHFGNLIIDTLFLRLSLKVAKFLELGTGLCNNLVISMIKK